VETFEHKVLLGEGVATGGQNLDQGSFCQQRSQYGRDGMNDLIIDVSRLPLLIQIYDPATLQGKQHATTQELGKEKRQDASLEIQAANVAVAKERSQTAGNLTELRAGDPFAIERTICLADTVRKMVGVDTLVPSQLAAVWQKLHDGDRDTTITLGTWPCRFDI
jgi:hypothetical protein